MLIILLTFYFLDGELGDETLSSDVHRVGMARKG